MNHQLRKVNFLLKVCFYCYYITHNALQTMTMLQTLGPSDMFCIQVSVLSVSRCPPAHPPPHQTASDQDSQGLFFGVTLFPVWTLNQQNRYSSRQSDTQPPDWTSLDQVSETFGLNTQGLAGWRGERSLWLADKCDLWSHRSWCEHLHNGADGGTFSDRRNQVQSFGWTYLPEWWDCSCFPGPPGRRWSCLMAAGLRGHHEC